MKLSRQTRTRLKVAGIGTGAVAAVLLTALAVSASTSQRYAPPVSDKVASYYEANKSLPTAKPSKPAGPAVAFLGDSYTAGTGADPVAARWTTHLSQAMNWTESNYGQGGTGYASQGPTPPKTSPYPTRIADLAGSKPSIVIVSGGRNDLSVDGDAGESIAKTFQSIRAALPAAQIIALNPWWDDDQAPAELAGVADEVRSAVESVKGTYVDSGQPLLGHKDMVITDGVHPNAAGHTALAEAVARALPAEFKKP